MTVLTVGFAGLWAYGYAYLTAMACAWSTGACNAPWPWDMRGEDLQFLVLIPGAIFFVLLAATVLLWRKPPGDRIKT